MFFLIPFGAAVPAEIETPSASHGTAISAIGMRCSPPFLSLEKNRVWQRTQECRTDGSHATNIRATIRLFSELRPGKGTRLERTLLLSDAWAKLAYETQGLDRRLAFWALEQSLIELEPIAHSLGVDTLEIRSRLAAELPRPKKATPSWEDLEKFFVIHHLLSSGAVSLANQIDTRIVDKPVAILTNPPRELFSQELLAEIPKSVRELQGGGYSWLSYEVFLTFKISKNDFQKLVDDTSTRDYRRHECSPRTTAFGVSIRDFYLFGNVDLDVPGRYASLAMCYQSEHKPAAHHPRLPHKSFLTATPERSGKWLFVLFYAHGD